VLRNPNQATRVPGTRENEREGAFGNPNQAARQAGSLENGWDCVKAGHGRLTLRYLRAVKKSSRRSVNRSGGGCVEGMEGSCGVRYI